MNDERAKQLQNGKPLKEVYHGWIVVEKREGYMDRIYAEYNEGEERKRVFFSSPTVLLEWWDKRIGEKVKLLQTPLGAYRVYTTE